jgi:hypothetical protein
MFYYFSSFRFNRMADTSAEATFIFMNPLIYLQTVAG